MDTNQSTLKKKDYFAFISLLAFFTPITLYVFRHLDDNSLTSWQWIFEVIDIAWIFPILIIGTISALLLSKVTLFRSRPIFLFLFSYVAATFFWGEPEVIVDATRYFTQAKQLKIYGIGYFFHEWGRDIFAWTDLPLVPFLHGLIFKFIGESRPYIQACTTALFSATVLLTYLTGKSLWNDDIGFYAGLLLLGIPYLFTQVPLMLVDIPTMFFLTLSIYTFIKAVGQGGLRMIAISSVAVFFAFFSKYSTWLMLSVLVIIFIVYLRTEPRTTIKRGGMVALISLFLIVTAILLKYDVISEQIRLLMSYQRPGLRRWEESFISSFFFQTHPFLTSAALYSTYVAFRKKDLKYIIISYLVVLFVLLQIRRIRYIIPLFPMLTLMASYGLSTIRNTEIKNFIVYSIVISSLLIAFFAYRPFLEGMSAANIKNAGNFLNTLDITDIEVFTLPQEGSIINPAISVPLLDFFVDRKITFIKDFESKPDWSRVKDSHLRFTWEYKIPGYYTTYPAESGKAQAVAIISNSPAQIFPINIEQRIEKFSKSKAFMASTDVFKYRTIVTVFYD